MEEIIPVAVYNSDKKELVGIFATQVLVGKYLFECGENYKSKKVNGALRYKSKLSNTIFDFKVSLRYANESQVSLLSEMDFVMMDGYPSPSRTTTLGFFDTRVTLSTRQREKMKNKHNLLSTTTD